MKYKVIISTTIVLGIAALSFAILHKEAKPIPVGIKSNDFPDNEVCSLGCGVGWDTYCSFAGTYDVEGWNAHIGDEINWVIDASASGSFRFDGLRYDGGGIDALIMKLNGRLLKGTLTNGVFRIEKDEYVKAGDVISVVITSINANGHVNSIQPSGVH